MILLLYESDTGVSIEVGVTGRQGMLGISTVISDAVTPTRAVTYRSGRAFKMAASAVKEEFSECGDFQEICRYFTQSLINQVTQSAVCNRLHSVDQQMCRLLLKIHDHQNDEIVRLTHEQIAQALGVRRETVSIAASTLQENGLIKYSRGRIRLLDRKGLEGFTCECYKTETKGYKKLIAKYAAKHS